MTTLRNVLLAGCLVLVACAGPIRTTPSPSVAAPPPSVATASPRISDFTVGADRPVTVHVPAGLDPLTEAPILILLHGYGGNGDEQEQYMQLGPIAEARGLLYLHPDGTRDRSGAPSWNATDACCDVDGRNVDDSAYLAGLIAEVATHVAVDTRRVYFVGHSNGAFMSYRMACDHADVIAAIVSVAGASFADTAACQPSKPVAILQIQGSVDEIVKPDGGNLHGVLAPGDSRLLDYPSTVASLDAWAAYDGCTGELTPQTETLDLDRTLQGTTGPNETAVSAFEGCAEGGSVELWLIEGGWHDPEWTSSFGSIVIDYLLAHPKPA